MLEILIHENFTQQLKTLKGLIPLFEMFQPPFVRRKTLKMQIPDQIKTAGRSTMFPAEIDGGTQKRCRPRRRMATLATRLPVGDIRDIQTS